MSTFGPRTQDLARFLAANGVAFHSRAEWGARPPTRESPLAQIAGMFTHHSVTEPEPIGPTMQAIQSFHMRGRGWSDFAYNLAVRNADGSVWNGRGVDNEGGGTGSPEDDSTISVVAIGNYETDKPTPLMQHTYSVIWTWAKLHGATFNRGDRDVNLTACPGANLYRHIPWQPTAPPPPTPEDDMTPEQSRQLKEVHNALLGPGGVTERVARIERDSRIELRSIGDPSVLRPDDPRPVLRGYLTGLHEKADKILENTAPAP